ncbi:hypothetical protein [Nocardioides sp. SLBN-35]|uniref:hypothetical protein n=1 Tax=Nocardioides sp. SLBN-35 TaxID=2768445 RepID=UPI0011529FE1|nr:hypothetical protein [Nocardioides sp. SLBN-35]TQK72608.1 hypothetical protein FBY23_4425 [Nocardioides sp. SLBN-35]
MNGYDEHTTELPREERPADGDDRRRTTGWHRVNTGHLVMGVAFTGLVIVWALAASDTVQIEDNGWIMGLPWLAAGIAGLLASVLRGRHYDQGWDQNGWDGHQMRGWQ